MSEPEDPSGQPVVLLVDDHPDTAEAVAEYLRRHGVRGIRVATPEQAEEVLEARSVDTVVTGYSIPGEDGIRLLSKLRATPTWATLPVVMVRGHSMPDEVAFAAKKLGARFVRMPFDLDTLVETVKQSLERSRAPRDEED